MPTRNDDKARLEAKRAAVWEKVQHLLQDQEPLGAEFEAIWDANLDDLYES